MDMDPNGASQIRHIKVAVDRDQNRIFIVKFDMFFLLLLLSVPDFLLEFKFDIGSAGNKIIFFKLIY